MAHHVIVLATGQKRHGPMVIFSEGSRQKGTRGYAKTLEHDVSVKMDHGQIDCISDKLIAWWIQQ